MLADFVVFVHYGESDKPRGVRVKVHDNVAALRMAATKYTKVWSSPKQRKTLKDEFAHTLGICHRMYMQSDPVCAIVRLAPPNIGIGIVTHELMHAAVHIWEIEHQFDDTPLRCDNDEELAWVMGELVRCTVNALYEREIWKDD